jgi:hypothetical protein
MIRLSCRIGCGVLFWSFVTTSACSSGEGRSSEVAALLEPLRIACQDDGRGALVIDRGYSLVAVGWFRLSYSTPSGSVALAQPGVQAW